MEFNRRRLRRQPPGNSGSNSQASAPPPNPHGRRRRPPESISQNPRPSLTFSEGTESINMSHPQNNLSAPAGNGRVVINNVNVSCGDGEDTTRTNAQHEDLHDHDLLTARGDHEIYCTHLLTKKRGFPLWVPGPGMQHPIEYRRQGIGIGDVGIITPTGGFDFLFNIFESADGAINGGMVPQGFSPLPRQGLERGIQQTMDYGPDTYLTSSSVRRISMDLVSEASIDQTFQSTAKEAAILIMPDGAKTQDLLKTRGLRDTITSNARDWYTYARSSEAGGRDVRNGGIRVIVGVDKVSSWGIATSACNTGQTASYVFKHDPIHTYKWDCIGGSGRVGPQKGEIRDLIEDDVAPQNQCVFVRTINFTLSGKTWSDQSSEAVQQGLDSGRFEYYRGSGSRNRGRPREGHGSFTGSTPSSGRPTPGSSLCSESVLFDPVEVGIIHPSAALHNYLHEKFPDADMVITDDMNWMSILNGDDVVFPEPEELCTRVLEAHDLQNDSGIVQLIRKDDTKLQPSSSMNLGKAEDIDLHKIESNAGVSQQRISVELELQAVKEELDQARKKIDQYKHLVTRLYNDLDTLRNTICSKCKKKIASLAASSPSSGRNSSSSTPLLRRVFGRRPALQTNSGSPQIISDIRNAKSTNPWFAFVPWITSFLPAYTIPLGIGYASISPSSEWVSFEPTSVPTPTTKSLSTAVDDIPNSPKAEPDKGDWSVVHNQTLNVQLAHTLKMKSEVFLVKFSRDGEYLAVGLESGETYIYNIKALSNRVLVEQTAKERSCILAVQFSPDGKCLATGGSEGRIKIWNIEERRVVAMFKGCVLPVYSLDFSPDSQFLVSSSSDCSVRIWRMRDGSSKQLVDANMPAIDYTALSPDGRFIAAATYDGMLRIWNFRSGQLLARWKAGEPGSCLFSVVFTSDGKGLLSGGGGDKTMRYWDVSSLAANQTLSRRGALDSGDMDKEKGDLTFWGCTGTVDSISTFPDSRWALSGSNDGSVCIWDSRTGTLQCTLNGHKKAVMSTDTSSDGYHLATGAKDCLVTIWRYEQVG